MERQDVVAEVAGSLRLEGLEPSLEARELAAAWARGDVGDEDLLGAEQRLLSNAGGVRSGAPRAA
ncbi:MAG TPA: antitoxin VbhA family protein [Solirubrobacteraceae bacterium]|nr:antitoxin VbhA family protein [Solirubrobacteraceae bacterium]